MTVALVLALVTAAVYWQVHNHQFIRYDDPEYILQNPNVRTGISMAGIAWAFTTGYAADWHPLTWISHMLDCQLFGPDPTGPHLMNLLFHIANTVLLFVVFRRMTGRMWESAFVAAVFALHPLHVESVAWVSERKDVLSTLLWILTIGAYVRYVRTPSTSTYIVPMLLFMLGLMAKPMLVTLPFVLLLLDYWPLKRTALGGGNRKQTGSAAGQKNGMQLWLLIREKIPFFALTIASSIITYLEQQSGGATASEDILPFDVRAGNAVVSYVGYLAKSFWPSNLAVIYPHTGLMPSAEELVPAALVLLAITAWTFALRKRHRYLIVGWLWFVGTLVPVIGLVQVGRQAMADRYMYVPLIGISIMVAWGVSALFASVPNRRTILKVCFGAIVLLLALTCWLQVGYWRNTFTLFHHTIDVTKDNYIAHSVLALAYLDEGQLDSSLVEYSRLSQLRKVGFRSVGADDFEIEYNMGIASAQAGDMSGAIAHFTEAVHIDPNNAEVRNNLANALTYEGKFGQAVIQYSEALRINPDYAEVHYNLGNLLAQQGQLDLAIDHLSMAVRLKPDYQDAREALQEALQLRAHGKQH